MTIVMIGSGNVAHCFSHLLQIKGHQIIQVLSRTEQRAALLAESLNAAWTTDFRDIHMGADVYLIAVSDAAIPALNAELRLGKRIVAHTAGAMPLDAIAQISANTGVFYPLQSIRAEILVQQKIPMLIEANNDTVLRRLRALAEAISDEVIEMDSVSRLKMHLAAVCCNNFPYHLIRLCRRYLENQSLDFSLLRPLMKETFGRLESEEAYSLQTGPASRGDTVTMEKHLRLLEDYPYMRQLYALMSESIRAASQPENPHS